jgi:Flp pilus assembly pilin Flp
MQLDDRKGISAKRFLAGLLRDRSAATAIEYSLLAALIGLAIVIAAGLLGVSLHDLYLMFGNLDAWNAQP